MSKKENNGFTLIEMLVTMTGFSIALSALVMGLASGAKTWDTVNNAQRRQTEIEDALRSMAEDIDGASIFSKDIPGMKLTNADSGDGQVLTFTSFGDRRRQKEGRGCVWKQVQYKVGNTDLANETQTNAQQLIRVSLPFVTSESFDMKPIEEPLINNVKKVGFTVLQSGEESKEWTEETKLPDAVIVRIQLDSGPTHERCMIIPTTLMGKQE
jgi:type II secretion system protein J